MKKVILLILDGFGLRDSENGNAIKMATLPNITNILSTYSVSELETSGEDVGLPSGVSGNSEVGHITIGAGRTVKQPYTIINDSIKDKSFFENDNLLDLIDHVNSNDSTLHLIGMISDAGNHSSIDHFYAALALAKIKKVKSVVFHFITDGMDSNISALEHINSFMEKANKLQLGIVGTISGRYYAIDSENGYDKVKKVYDALVYNKGNNMSDYARCLELHYKNNITDEYINPSIITKGSNIKDNDGVLFVDFRCERMDKLISSLVEDSFNMFSVKTLKNVKYAALYSTNEKIQGIYTNEVISNTFGKYLAGLEFKQARIAEAVKYPHVTYFFDGAEEFSDKNLYKILVPSPNVARYDMKPDMSIAKVTTAVLNTIDDDFDFILVNFANPDVVGHTGNIPATLRALEACDICLGKILEKANENFYEVVITSDHGNVECMKDENGKVITSHTSNKVPFVICNSNYKLKKSGSLKDVIPTVIDVFEISKPKEMTGESLIIKE
ncbi:MAG: 2,3-bisphosphoglycerate-independent phosphoglycerate mutase [bacterium]|nr:2,3-bisphosphoglycerate-independent phosphoglycerate mutase [bacterium]